MIHAVFRTSLIPINSRFQLQTVSVARWTPHIFSHKRDSTSWTLALHPSHATNHAADSRISGGGACDAAAVSADSLIPLTTSHGTSATRQIGTRRNELLREMFHLIQKRDALGAVLSMEDDDDEGLQLFLERFDMEKQ